MEDREVLSNLEASISHIPSKWQKNMVEFNKVLTQELIVDHANAILLSEKALSKVNSEESKKYIQHMLEGFRAAKLILESKIDR